MENSYQLLFREMQAGFALHEIILDDAGKPVDYRFLAVNPAFEHLTGLKAKDIVEKTVREVLPNIDQSSIDRYGEVALTGKSVCLEEYSKDVDRYFQINAYSPAHHQFACTFIDITSHRQAEKVLQESEITLRALLNAVHDSLFLMDPDGTVIAINQTTAERLGSTPEELVGKDIYTYVSPEVAEYRRGQAQQAIASKQVVRFTDQRSDRWIENTVYPVLDENGQVHQLAIFGQDITERKQAEEKLKESAAQLAHSQQIAHLGSWKFDVPANRLDWSDEVFRIFGCDPQEFEATYEAFLGFVHPDDRAAVNEAYTRSVRERRDHYEIDHRIIRKATDEVRFVHERCVNEFDETDAVIRSIGMVQDITERKQAEERLHLHTQMLNAIGQAAMATDLQRRIIYWNHAAEMLFGWKAEEVIGRDVVDLTPSQHAQEQAKAIMETLMAGQSWSGELNFQRKDGKELDLAVTDSPVFDDTGKIIGIIGISYDLSERKKAEAELYASEARYRTVVAAANEAIVLQERSGKILTWNASAERLLGLTEQEALGQTSTSRKWNIFSEDGSALPGEKHPSMHTLNTGQPCRDVLVKIVRDDQTFSWANVSTNPVFLGETNRPDLVVITIQDITERKLAEMALKEREREISTLLDNLPGMAYRCKNDKDWTMLFVSQGCFELTGYHPQDLILNAEFSYGELVHPDDQERIWREIQAAITNDQPFVIEYRIRDRAGQEHWVWERGQVIQGSDGDQTIEGFITDISKRKRAEEKLHQKMNDLERFNHLTVDREMRMIELKKEINALLKAAGQPEKYRIIP